jgi:hypothetical protein
MEFNVKRLQTFPVLALALFAVACSAASMPAAQQPTAVPQVQPAASAVTYDGIAQGITAEGHPYLGDPAARVTLIDYSDFL